MYGFIIKFFVIIKHVFEDANLFILKLIALEICLICGYWVVRTNINVFWYSISLTKWLISIVRQAI